MNIIPIIIFFQLQWRSRSCSGRKRSSAALRVCRKILTTERTPFLLTSKVLEPSNPFNHNAAIYNVVNFNCACLGCVGKLHIHVLHAFTLHENRKIFISKHASSNNEPCSVYYLYIQFALPFFHCVTMWFFFTLVHSNILILLPSYPNNQLFLFQFAISLCWRKISFCVVFRVCAPLNHQIAGFYIRSTRLNNVQDVIHNIFHNLEVHTFCLRVLCQWINSIVGQFFLLVVLGHHIYNKVYRFWVFRFVQP